MAITVQFLLNWLSIVIPNYEKSVSNYRKAKKGKKPKEIIELIYNTCLNEAQKNNDIEIEPHFHDSRTLETVRFNNVKKIKGRLKINVFSNLSTKFQTNKVLLKTKMLSQLNCNFCLRDVHQLSEKASMTYLKLQQHLKEVFAMLPVKI